MQKKEDGDKKTGKGKKRMKKREREIVKNRATGPQGFRIGTRMSLVV